MIDIGTVADLVLVMIDSQRQVRLLSCLKPCRDRDFNLEAQAAAEGIRSGTYVRVELFSVPAELVTHFDPHYPIIVALFCLTSVRGWCRRTGRGTAGSQRRSRPGAPWCCRLPGSGSRCYLCSHWMTITSRCACSCMRWSICTATRRSSYRTLQIVNSFSRSRDTNFTVQTAKTVCRGKMTSFGRIMLVTGRH